ncbi:hypothetical protein Golomagni_04192 [Golovinomyces magnicellulatus]|nr:hypothetical protein Golomagni_04192 [Golovinomyces magnicellulatus]
MANFSRPVSVFRAVRKIKIPVINSIPHSHSFYTSTNLRSSDHAHESQYDPPSGWLFGVKPGERRKKEDWEDIWVYGFFGSLAFGVVGYAFKPDTSARQFLPSIGFRSEEPKRANGNVKYKATWALEEARRRLEIEGILKEPEDKPNKIR